MNYFDFFPITNTVTKPTTVVAPNIPATVSCPIAAN